MAAHGRRSTRIVISLLAVICMTAVQAQDYPSRPVRIITDSAPGSAIDVILRVVGERLTTWGPVLQQIGGTP